MTYCNAILPSGKLFTMHITYGKVFGGLRKLLCFGYFLKMEVFRSELLTGQQTQLYKTLYNSALKNIYIYINFNFRHLPKLSIGFEYFFLFKI